MEMLRVDKYDAHSWIASIPTYADIVKVQIDAFNNSQKTVLDRMLAEARDEGREEVWNMMRRIMLSRREESEAYTFDQVKEAFDVITIIDVLKMPLTDAMASDKKLREKIKREREKLHVGDEVLVNSPFDFNADFKIGKRAYVVNVNVGENGEYVRVLLKGEGTRIVTPDACKKTGKHNPDIVKVMNSL